MAFFTTLSVIIFGFPKIVQDSQYDSLRQEIHKPLRVSGKKVYIEDRLLSKDEVYRLLGTVPSGIEQYKKGTKMQNAGSLLYVGGGIIGLGGVALGLYGDFKMIKEPKYENIYVTGIIIAIVGELMLDGGVIFKMVGAAKVRRSINNYNDSIKSFGYKPGVLYYELGMLNNGNVGIKVSF